MEKNHPAIGHPRLWGLRIILGSPWNPWILIFSQRQVGPQSTMMPPAAPTLPGFDMFKVLLAWLSGKHTKNYGKSPFFMGESVSTGPCYHQRVPCLFCGRESPTGAGLGLSGLGLPLPGLGAGLTAPAPGMPCAAGGEKEDSIGTYKGTVKSGGLRWVKWKTIIVVLISWIPVKSMK